MTLDERLESLRRELQQLKRIKRSIAAKKSHQERVKAVAAARAEALHRARESANVRLLRSVS